MGFKDVFKKSFLEGFTSMVLTKTTPLEPREP